MKTIVLLPCCKPKNNISCVAEKMYISPLFVKRLQYAKQLKPDGIYILSAKYGLLRCDDIIEPYNISLKTFSKYERVEWSTKVLNELKKYTNLEQDKFIILASDFYIRDIIPYITNYEMPLSFCSDKYVGKKMAWLNEHIIPEHLLF